MRALLVIVIAVAGTLLGISPARAHSDVTGSTPAASSTVTVAPTEVTLTFTGPIRGQFSTVVVTGPGGARFGTGAARAVDRTLHQAVRPLVGGEYTVAWRVVSGDGHPLQGVFRFTADLPGAPAAPPAAAPSEPDDGTGLFLAAAVAGLLVVGIGIVALARTRRKKH
ncbi:copper resistance CopC family protein [Cryptosporangium phraense]|uniref:copper resistance CopC family protein n=1 Tax=Cryptosporangium phraense TaxID=2593070 RepID=UPI001478DCC6|nr:copper resistance CopC family protein [Cryptosporangium phraense]